jgi:3-deoxy-D-manno-octulosonic-acid transferase
MMKRLYGLATDLAGPWLERHLERRAARGKEDADRLAERRGQSRIARPPGALLWLHGASIGETGSLLPLIAPLRRQCPGLQLLVTCGTSAAAILLAKTLPEGAVQQYLPLDRRAWVEAFFDHWRPDAGLIADSELWPNLLFAARQRHLKLALVNGRLSEKSFRRWRHLPGFAGDILRSFAVIAAIDETQRDRFVDLGAANAVATGNLKAAAPVPACDEAELARFRAACQGRKVVLLASSHEPEERLLTLALAPLLSEAQRPLLLLAPRHPARADAIAEALRPAMAEGHALKRRSQGDLPGSEDGAYLADSLGEMGLWFRLADIVIMGGSLAPKGGHNPIEPAWLGRAILTGPHLDNFADLYARLAAAGGCRLLPDAPSLAGATMALLADPAARGELGQAAQRFARGEAAVLDRTLAALAPVTEALAAAGRFHAGT